LKHVIRENLADYKKDNCVDIATGTGFLGGHFSEAFKNVIGVDISEA
jgi:methylase of polypeptide subunit release factors